MLDDNGHNEGWEEIWMRCMFLEDQSQSEKLRLMAYPMKITRKVSCMPSSTYYMWSLMIVSTKVAPPCFLEWVAWTILALSLTLIRKKIFAVSRSYPDDFATESKIEEFSWQLDNFVENIPGDSRFSDLKGFGDLCQKIVLK
jgi:hypothetical protein